jgi:ABC-type transporter Mla maintaining outer membrane lipid asymmetry ATPase subunit MlaF
VISHDMGSALRIADSIHLLADGRVKVSGTPDELAFGKDPLARRFIEASGVDPVRVRQKREAASAHVERGEPR